MSIHVQLLGILHSLLAPDLGIFLIDKYLFSVYNNIIPNAGIRKGGEWHANS